MIIDCEAALVNPRCADRVRYSRAKVGVAADNSGKPLLIVITSQMKEKFKILDNCTVRTTTISFESPKKDLYLRNCNQLTLKAFMSLITKIKSKQSFPKLANISNVEKMKPKATTLTIRDNDFNSTDLSNKCLQKLFCENFRIIPRLVWKLNNLVELRLTNSELTEIPLKLHDLGPNLRVLDLSNNHIKAIDGSFVLAMRRLIVLNLNHNQLDYIPLEIKLMTSLQRLDISHNQLTRLPYTLGTVVSLKELNISRNQLNCLSAALIKEIHSNLVLSNLDISGNPLKQSVFKSHLSQIKRFPTLQSLASTKVLATDCLLYSCHQCLPRVVYKSIQMNAEKCCFCGNELVDRYLKLDVVLKGFDSVVACLSTSHFPTFPLFPTERHVCYLCTYNSVLNFT